MKKMGLEKMLSLLGKMDRSGAFDSGCHSIRIFFDGSGILFGSLDEELLEFCSIEELSEEAELIKRCIREHEKDIDCTPPAVEETPLPKKRRFKWISDYWIDGFIKGDIYDEGYRPPYTKHTVKELLGIFGKEHWQEVFDEEEKIAPPTYPNPIYLSYDDVERGKWYDVRESLPDEGFDCDMLKVNGWYAKWDADLGGFVSVISGYSFDEVEEWMLP
jgi:hypothetical protein